MQFFLVLVTVLLAAGIAFAIVVLVTGRDPGLTGPGPEPQTLPTDRPLSEADISATRFDTGARGYRTTQVDQALARVAYDVGFKDELIKVLAGEVAALRDGRIAEADQLRQVRQRALGDDRTDTVDEPVDGESVGIERAGTGGAGPDEDPAETDHVGTGDSDDDRAGTEGTGGGDPETGRGGDRDRAAAGGKGDDAKEEDR